jgi:hypothetical protein
LLVKFSKTHKSLTVKFRVVPRPENIQGEKIESSTHSEFFFKVQCIQIFTYKQINIIVVGVMGIKN